MNIIEGLTIILSALTLIITIIGWRATYRSQQELLNKQIASDERRTKMQFDIPNKLEQFKKITEFVSECHRIRDFARVAYMQPDGDNALREKYRILNESFLSEIKMTVQFLDEHLMNLLITFWFQITFGVTYALTNRRNDLENPLWLMDVTTAENDLIQKLKDVEKNIIANNTL